MKKKLTSHLGILIIVMLICCVGFVGYRYHQHRQHAKAIAAHPVYFYGQECPHCHHVMDYIDRYQVQQSYPMTMKEVFHNQTNAYDYIRIAKQCGVLETRSENGAGSYMIDVPMLWTGKQCISGDIPIIQFLQKQSKNRFKK